MLVGLSVIAAELRFQWLLQQAGIGWRILLIVSGTGMSVWGLKEVIAAWWPRLGGKTGRRKRRFKIPVAGYGYVVVMFVLFLGALLDRSNPLMFVFALMAGPFIVSGTITFNMLRGLSVRRSVPKRAMAGEPFSVEVRLKNPKRILAAWLMTVRDRVDNGREYLNPEILFARVRPRSEEAGRYQLRLSQRGRYRFGPLQVNSRFPLGLMERGLVLAEEGEVLVYPRIGRVSSDWRRRMRTSAELVNQAQRRLGSFHDDFHRIREYRPGDEPRSIHWRTTARRNELMVREFRESRDRRLIVLLDVWLPERPTSQQRGRVEYAISLAATVALDQLRSGQQSDTYFAVSGRTSWEWGGSTGRRDRNELLDALALLQPSSAGDLNELLAAGRREQTPHSRTVLVTPFAERAALADPARPDPTSTETAGAWAEPPQILVADPEAVGAYFSLTGSPSAEGATS